jgi:hypothetical protein
MPQDKMPLKEFLLSKTGQCLPGSHLAVLKCQQCSQGSHGVKWKIIIKKEIGEEHPWEIHSPVPLERHFLN